jgi:hypothetical protein
MKKKDQKNFYPTPRNAKILDVLSMLTGKNNSQLINEGIELLEREKYRDVLRESGIPLEKVISIAERQA